jgi:hypothetical protein
MRDAKIRILAVASMAMILPACQAEQEPAENQVITDINAAEPGDIEALPPDESVDLPPENAADPRSPEERGDGDDMVNIIDDTGNRS